MYNDTSAKESQVEVLKQANAHLTEQRETAQQHLQNEKELRAGAEKHVKGLQKSLESNLADSEFKLDSLQKELESQKMALIASEQNLQAAWKQVTEGKDKHLSLEKEKSGWETSLASARREIANLNQVCYLAQPSQGLSLVCRILSTVLPTGTGRSQSTRKCPTISNFPGWCCN